MIQSKYATDTERRYLDAVTKHGSHTKAAKALGVARSTIDRALERLEKRTATLDPKVHGVTAPTGYHIPNSTVHLKYGEVAQQWVRYRQDGVDPEAILAAFREAVADDFPKSKPVRAPGVLNKDLCAVYPWGDPHFGMLAWAPETGADYDLEIAEKHHCAAVDILVEAAPPAETAVFINVGDASHADSANATTTAGTRVDVDSRWPKVQRAIIRTWVYAIRRMLTKHHTVYVFNAKGNHDGNTSAYISICLEAYFHDEPRVVIDPGVCKYQHFEFGKCFLGITHLDTGKPEGLGGVMLVRWPDVMARTVYRYWITGHIHHERRKEYPGYIVESVRTLAPKDNWHAEQGYMSGQSMFRDTLHRTRGRIGRHEVSIEEIREATGEATGAP